MQDFNLSVTGNGIYPMARGGAEDEDHLMPLLMLFSSMATIGLLMTGAYELKALSENGEDVKMMRLVVRR